MRLDDLLQVMREEFASAADDIDAALMAWLGDDPAQAAAHAMPVAALFERLADTARVISLEGHAVALDALRDTVQVLALLDEVGMGEGLGWLVAWRAPIAACFAEPGQAAAAQGLLDYLGAGPLAPPPEVIEALRALLAQPASLPAGSEDAALAPATPDDVSLEVPADVDAGLYEAFLAEAPEQLARLGDAARALARAPQPVERLVEAQRVAHTFKGSGNIIGIRGVARLAHRIEDLIDFAIERDGGLPPAIGHDLEQAVATLDQMVYALRGEEELPRDAQQRLQALLDWIEAIREDRWAERAEAHAPAPQVAVAASEARRESPTRAAAAATTSVEASGSDSAPAEAQLRVGVTRLERLVRRGGQALVQNGRVDEHLRVLEERLAAIEANNQLLRGRLRELETALERQGVNLNERADAEGGAFDALEMDRYNELHALSRFVTELVADELELARSARVETQLAQATQREHGQALKEQHRELLGARLVPFRQIGARLRRNVSQTAATTGKRVRVEIEGEQVQLDSDVLDRLTEPLLHLLRNAVDHGIEPPEERLLYGKDEEGVVHLRCSRDGQTVRIECRDDGRGLDLAAIHAKAVALGLAPAGPEPDSESDIKALTQMILLPGFSTREQVSEVSGRGVGMDVVADRLRAMKGHIDITSQPLEGSCFTLRVPATTGSTHALVVRVAGELLAIPSEAVLMALAADQGERHGDRLHHGGHDARLVELADWLGLPLHDEVAGQGRPVVLVRLPGELVALQVDAVLDARELILQDVGALLRRVRGVIGGALRPDGRVMFVIDLEPLASRRAVDRAVAAQLRRRATVERKRLLVVDDALSVRKALSQLLEDAGWRVDAARDGFEALDALQRERYDLVLTDLEMPNLNGLELTRQLRQREATRALPVVMITSRSSDKHRASAAEAGVTHYLTKPYTDADLLAQVRGLLGASGG